VIADVKIAEVDVRFGQLQHCIFIHENFVLLGLLSSRRAAPAATWKTDAAWKTNTASATATTAAAASAASALWLDRPPVGECPRDPGLEDSSSWHRF
jgi:hypothetical protein